MGIVYIGDFFKFKIKFCAFFESNYRFVSGHVNFDMKQSI
jgi:hypothetical protein